MDSRHGRLCPSVVETTRSSSRRRVGPDEPASSVGPRLQEACLDETLSLPVQRGQRYVESLGKFGEAELMVGIQQEPGEQVW